MNVGLADLSRSIIQAARSSRLGRGAGLAASLIFLCIGVVPCSASAAARPRKQAIDPAAIMLPLPPATIDNTLAIGGDTIDARKVNSRMTVAVSINGQGPYRFVVDSGADTSVVGLRAASALQLPAGTPVLLNGVTDSSRVDRVRVEALGLGQSTIRNLQLPVLRDRDLGGDGMLGIDALVEQRLMLDFEKRLILVEDAQRPPPSLDGEIVVVAKLRRGQLILTRVTANGLPLDAVVDTGSEITIGNLALRDRLVGSNRDKLTSISVIGVTGVAVDMQMVQIAELKLGSVILRNVPIAFADVPPFFVFGLAHRPALLLGTDLMENFRRVSLDFRRRKVRFQLRSCNSTGFVLTTSPSNTLTRLALADGGGDACRR